MQIFWKFRRHICSTTSINQNQKVNAGNWNWFMIKDAWPYLTIIFNNRLISFHKFYSAFVGPSNYSLCTEKLLTSMIFVWNSNRITTAWLAIRLFYRKLNPTSLHKWQKRTKELFVAGSVNMETWTIYLKIPSWNHSAYPFLFIKC